MTLRTVLGADELLGIRLNEPKSAQEQFFFSTQWTREGLRDFKFPIVIWLTPEIATSLAQQAPDFWSWRGGVFEFSFPFWISSSLNLGKEVKYQELVLPSFANISWEISDLPSNLQKQINEIQSQDPDSPLLASLYNSLGDAFKKDAHYSEAEKSYKKALDLHERKLEDKNLDITGSLNNLAELYEYQGNYTGAESLYKRILEIKINQLGEEHPEIVTSINNLSKIYLAQGKYNEAEFLYFQVLKITEKLIDSEDLDVAISLDNLANIHINRDKREFKNLGEFIKFSLQQKGWTYSDLAKSTKIPQSTISKLVNNITINPNFSTLKKLSQGLQVDVMLLVKIVTNPEFLYSQSLKIKEQQLGKDHPSIASSLVNLALLYQSQGKYNQAEALYERALEIIEASLGKEHSTAKTIQDGLKRLRDLKVDTAKSN